MIPKKSTPIKNDILIDIFAKGLLNKDEMRIVFYIIRWSWGFDGVKRRQDWTKKLTKRQIADDINMHESHINRNINMMIKKNIIFIKEGCYQFNEHYKEWKNLPNSQVFNNKKLTKMVSKTYQNGKVNLPKSKGKLNKLVSSIDLKPLQNKPLPDRKETLKETNTKEIQKKNVFPIIKEIVTYLNEKANKFFRPETLTTQKFIKARLKEGYDLSAFKWVIDVKCAEWKGKFTKNGKDMEDWLRPKTLFGTNFESYLNQTKRKEQDNGI